MTDPNAPYVCCGCGRRYETDVNPDQNCPACGEKYGPAYHRDGSPFFARHEAKCHDGCEAEVDRASGDVVCACGRLYREHPGCFQTRYEHRGRGYYGTKVLCDGRHVHL